MRHLLPLLCILALQAGMGADAPSDDRDVALWVLRKGGRVRVDGAIAYTSDPFDLPENAFRIAGVDMHGTLVDPKDMEPLSRLPELQEALLPARVWSPTFDIKSPFGEEMFDYFANSKKLVKFEAGLRVCPRCGKPVHLSATTCRDGNILPAIDGIGHGTTDGLLFGNPPQLAIQAAAVLASEPSSRRPRHLTNPAFQAASFISAPSGPNQATSWMSWPRMERPWKNFWRRRTGSAFRRAITPRT
jgi:hypothetical protein